MALSEARIAPAPGRPGPSSERAADPTPSPEIASERLFGDARRLLIHHEGQCYTLRVTRQGKLLLTK